MLKKTAVVGIDGVTWQDYKHDLEEKLIDLHGRLHRGKGFFDTIDHEWLIKFLPHRIGDRSSVNVFMNVEHS